MKKPRILSDAETIEVLAKVIGCTKKEIKRAIISDCIVDEIRAQIEWLRENPECK